MNHFDQVQASLRKRIDAEIEKAASLINAEISSEVATIAEQLKVHRERVESLRARLSDIPAKLADLNADADSVQEALAEAIDDAGAFATLTKKLPAIRAKKEELEALRSVLAEKVLPQEEAALAKFEADFSTKAIGAVRRIHAAKRDTALQEMERINGELDAFELATKDVGLTLGVPIFTGLVWDFRFRLTAEGPGMPH